MEQERGSIRGLPGNAYTPLAEGETYIPYVPADKAAQEITLRSVGIGVVMAILFSFSACYLGLVAGQVFEAAIPIAILAVGAAGLFARRSTILENVIIQSIGAASGVVVAGAIFTLPAMYILGLQISLLHTFVACTLGGFLGILFLVPLRRYFCVDEHGKLPFPEATATTEILATGERGGKSAMILVVSMLVLRITKRIRREEGNTPKERGTLIASGYIAGGALMGVLGALLNLNEIGKPVRFISVGARYVERIVGETGRRIWEIPAEGGYASYFESVWGQLISLVLFIGLAVFCYAYAKGRTRD